MGERIEVSSLVQSTDNSAWGSEVDLPCSRQPTFRNERVRILKVQGVVVCSKVRYCNTGLECFCYSRSDMSVS